MLFQSIANAIWLIELLVDFGVMGFFKAFEKEFSVWPESMCQILNIYTTISVLLNVKNFSLYHGFVVQF